MLQLLQLIKLEMEAHHNHYLSQVRSGHNNKVELDLVVT